MKAKLPRSAIKEDKLTSAINVFDIKEILLQIGLGKGGVNSIGQNQETALTKAAGNGDDRAG